MGENIALGLPSSQTLPLAKPIEGTPICGLRLHPFTWDEVFGRIFDTSTGERITVGNVNLHGAFLGHHDAGLLEFYQDVATFNHLDGAPLLLFAKLLGSRVERKNLTPWLTGFDPFLAKSVEKKQKVYYIGSKPGVAAKMAEIMRGRFPGLQIEVADGYFNRDDATENGKVIDKINAWEPDILLVGMGVPIQENWLRLNRAKINARVAVVVGASADYVADVIPMPPAWVEKIYMLWLFRLLSEPKRLWYRYIVEPWYVVFCFFRYGRRLRKV